jgi:hypothetical protein
MTTMTRRPDPGAVLLGAGADPPGLGFKDKR